MLAALDGSTPHALPPNSSSAQAVSAAGGWRGKVGAAVQSGTLHSIHRGSAACLQTPTRPMDEAAPNT